MMAEYKDYNNKILDITDDIIKFNGWSNFYFFKPLNMLIDCGRKTDFELLKLQKILSAAGGVKVIVFTHFHFDHIGYSSLFPEAELYASRIEIEDFAESPFNTVLNEELALEFKKSCFENITPIDELKEKFKVDETNGIKGIEVIKTPGHTRGSICIHVSSKGILFTGDAYFRKGIHGRTDLPTSAPEKMAESVNKIEALVQASNTRIILAGHDY